VVAAPLTARDFAGAGKLLAPMAMVAGQMKNRLITSGVRNKVQQVKDVQIEYERLKGAMNRPGGELAAGKFACFFEDDWEHGLARLANSSDAKIKDAAAKDIAGPKTAGERMALGNAWWEIAQKQTVIGKTKFEGRARNWYRQALSDLGGLERVQAERRIASSLGAPEDATMFGGHAYTVSTAKYGWNEAKVVCELSGGHLAYVESSEEWNFIVKFATGPIYWLGASDPDEDGNWRWLNGSAFTFKAWQSGQPDNSKGIQHFLCAFNAGWDDAERQASCAIICEWE
jgi:lectin-like protein